MSNIRIGNSVWIIKSKKIDGRYNRGKVVGIEMSYNGLGYLSETQFIKDHKISRYKVAYVDVVTKKACSEWLYHKDVSKEKPLDA